MDMTLHFWSIPAAITTICVLLVLNASPNNGGFAGSNRDWATILVFPVILTAWVVYGLSWLF